MDKPDLALIDISLKGADGLELTKAIRAQQERMPILIVSMHNENVYAERALRAGANGYIMKEEMAENIIQAIRTVLAGKYLHQRKHPATYFFYGITRTRV